MYQPHTSTARWSPYNTTINRPRVGEAGALPHTERHHSKPTDDSQRTPLKPKYEWLTNKEVDEFLSQNDATREEFYIQLRKAGKFEYRETENASLLYRFLLCIDNRTFQFGYLRFYTSLLVARLDPDFTWESFIKGVFKNCPDLPGACAKFKEEFDGLEKLKLGLIAKKTSDITWRDIIHKDIGLDLNNIKNCNCRVLLRKHGVPPEELDAVCDLLNSGS